MSKSVNVLFCVSYYTRVT